MNKRLWTALEIAKRVILPTVMAGTIIGVLVYRENVALNEENAQRAGTAATEAVELADQRLRDTILALSASASFFENSDQVTAQEFTGFMESLYQQLPQLLLIQHIDADGTGQQFYPVAGSTMSRTARDYISDKNVAVLLKRTKQGLLPASSPPLPLPNGFPGLYLVYPIEKDGGYDGAILGVVSLPTALADAMRHADNLGYEVHWETGGLSISSDLNGVYTDKGEQILYPNVKVDNPSAPIHQHGVEGKKFIERRFFLADREWVVHLTYSSIDWWSAQWATITIATIFFITIGLLLSAIYLENRKKTELANRERDFVSLVSHQLRLPLTQIRWATDMLSGCEALPPDKKEAATEANQIAVNGARLVENLLNVSRIDRGVLKMDIETASLKELIKETLLPLKAEASDLGVEIVLGEIAPVDVSIDRLKVVEVLRNIIDNAIKYGRQGKTVRVAATQEKPGMATVSVQDFGAGMTEETAKHVFDKASMFSKKESSTGAGLGLYLAKRFTEMMGGQISFVTAPGKGTTFMVDLKLADQQEG